MTPNTAAILATYRLATAAELTHGRCWYPQARQVADTLAERYGVTVATAAGVIAALSPRNKWERNLQDAESVISAYVAAGAEAASACKVCTFSGNKAKAVAILQQGSDNADDVAAILSGPKLREFYGCIMGADDVCIDGHAYSIWTGGRVTLADVPSIGVKLRKQIKADYRAAAELAGVSGSEMQATTWVTWRRIHGVG